MNLNEDLELEAWAARPFTSEAFRAEAFASARYKTDANFRDAVARKLAVSSIGIEPKSFNESRQIEVTRDAETGGLVLSAEERLAEINGPLSVAPAARAKAQAGLADAWKEKARIDEAPPKPVPGTLREQLIAAYGPNAAAPETVARKQETGEQFPRDEGGMSVRAYEDQE